MKCYTLDTNCIIDLEENRENAEYLQELVRLWTNNDIELAVVSVTASENQPSGKALKNYSTFEKKLERIGLLKAKELQPVMFWDFGFWDHCLWSSDELDEQVSSIKNVLFPVAAAEPPHDPSENSKWRNQMCDVLVAWSHTFHGSDYLVTGDLNFHKKKDQLGSLGIMLIVTPEEAVQIARGA